jgi:DNA polymerase (family 10)
MDRIEIAAALQEIGLLLQLKEKDKFRARAYARAAQAVADLGDDFDALVDEDRLTEISGIGKSLAAVITELYTTGKSTLLEKLHQEFPAKAVPLLQIPGLSKKRALQLHQALGINNPVELRKSLERGELSSVPGFGAKTQEKIREILGNYEERGERILLVHAFKIGGSIIDHMRDFPGLIDIDIAGSARRYKETVSIVRITASSNEPERLVKRFLRFPAIIEVIAETETNVEVRLLKGAMVSFSAADPAEYASLLHRETGSEAHLNKLKKIARLKSQRTKSATTRHQRKGFVTEADIYAALNLQYTPPELREDEGEIELAQNNLLPDDLITGEDIKGMIHCHSTYSDGRNTIEEMALAAQSMGMRYLTITDHSPTAHYAGGLTIERLKRQWDEIDRVQERVSIKLLRGTESDLLRDGALDYPDHILEKLDVIIGSIHNRYRLDEDAMTKRIITAMKNPHCNVWGHPLGRLLQKRDPISCRVEEILDVVAESGVVIEISGDPHRLDLEPRWIKEARKRSIKFVISTDAHSINDLNNLKFGIGLARRGGVRRGEVLNSLPWRSFTSKISAPSANRFGCECSSEGLHKTGGTRV